LGVGAGSNVTTANNVICIGAEGNNVDNSCYIGQIFGATSSGGTAVFINTNGRLGTATSSRRFKEEIKPMEQASEALFALKPVAFRYKKGIDPAGTQQLGLVAEEVEKVNRDLVVRDREGKPYSVRYDQVNAMLLNEFLKEHRKVEEQQATIGQLKSAMAQQQMAMETVVARLKEYDSKIQRVSDQVQMSSAERRTVVSKQ
jgi:trimeric autotransporter adhesin